MDSSSDHSDPLIMTSPVGGSWQHGVARRSFTHTSPSRIAATICNPARRPYSSMRPGSTEVHPEAWCTNSI